MSKTTASDAATGPVELEATVNRLLQLPPDQRLAIGERLIESVPVEIDEDTMEIYKRRARELEDGTVKGIPAREVMRDIRKMLDEEFPLPS